MQLQTASTRYRIELLIVGCRTQALAMAARHQWNAGQTRADTIGVAESRRQADTIGVSETLFYVRSRDALTG
jgi:hypothetical protein